MSELRVHHLLQEKATETEKAETLGIKMQLQKRYDDELKRMTNMVHHYYTLYLLVYLKVKHMITFL